VKRTRIKPLSNKRQKQMMVERELTRKLFIKQKGLCAECHKPLGWGSSKHEIKFRSRGGDPTDEENCQLLCLKCHNKAHGIKEGIK